MNAPILNHIISFANVSDIDSYLKKYAKAGFVVGGKTVRHEPGLRNGFVYFGPEYVEFQWVEDKKKFKKDASEHAKLFHRNPSPYGVAFEAKDIAALHRQWLKRGYKLPPIWSKGPADVDKSTIWWTFQDIPRRYLPGAWTFVLSYEFRKNKKGPRHIPLGKNTLYAMSGLTFVTKYPKNRAEKWKKFLAPASPVTEVISGVYRVHIGPHILEWVTPKIYKLKYGADYRQPISGKYKDLREPTLIHILADDLRKAKSVLKRNKFKLREYKDQFLIESREEDGFAFIVEEKKIQDWQKERSKFGQQFILE